MRTHPRRHAAADARYLSTALAVLGLGVCLVGPLSPRAHAQATPDATAFPDVPANHWAYDAVRDLAAKGYVKGYPNGEFLGQRSLTRYEFAQVIERMVQTITDLNTKLTALATTPKPEPPTVTVTPTGTPVTLDDLNKLQTLIDSFKAQLDANTTDITALKSAGYQAQIDALRSEVSALHAEIAKAQAGADRAYGNGPGKFQISGFIQARFEKISSGNQTAYPNGTTANVGPAQSYNGNYAAVGDDESFYVRRARLRATGAVTENAHYAIQLDVSNSSAATPVDVREANMWYTFGHGDALRSPTITAGQFANPFGYVLNESAADFLAPERPLALSDASSGLWQNQDYDRGASIGVPFARGFKASFAVINGTGRGASAGVSNNIVTASGASSIDDKRSPDEVYRLAYTLPTTGSSSTFTLGTSYYDGTISRSLATNAAGDPAFTGSKYQGLKKDLTGIDLNLRTGSGILLQGEYVTGEFDERTYVSAETPSSNVGTTIIANAYAPNNKVDGYYGWLGYILPHSGVHAATAGFDYDVFDRSKSGVSAGETDSNGQAILGGVSGGSFTDKNIGYGAMYNLDRAMQIKLWYDKPLSVSHAANLPTPQNVGLFTAQLQVRF